MGIEITQNNKKQIDSPELSLLPELKGNRNWQDVRVP
jgi:hypothetical protein